MRDRWRDTPYASRPRWIINLVLDSIFIQVFYIAMELWREVFRSHDAFFWRGISAGSISEIIGYYCERVEDSSRTQLYYLPKGSAILRCRQDGGDTYRRPRGNHKTKRQMVLELRLLNIGDL